jgi:hypothetical protein
LVSRGRIHQRKSALMVSLIHCSNSSQDPSTHLECGNLSAGKHKAGKTNFTEPANTNGWKPRYQSQGRLRMGRRLQKDYIHNLDAVHAGTSPTPCSKAVFYRS